MMRLGTASRFVQISTTKKLCIVFNRAGKQRPTHWKVTRPALEHDWRRP